MGRPEGLRKTMAAIEETRPKVEERPATHHKKAQTYVLALAIFMIVVFALSAYSKMTNTAPKLFATDDSRQPRLQEAPKRNSAAFAEEVARAKQKLLDGLSPKQTTPPPPVQLVTAPVASQRIPWPKPYAPSTSSQDNKRMEDLVYASRVENLDVNLGFAPPVGTPPQATPRAASSPAGSIDAEIARVQQLRNNLLSKGSSAGNVAALPVVASSVLAGASLPSPQPRGSVASSVVGQPQSTRATPLPGQKLLPLTTVIRATLDQTVISDYVGPLRLLVVDDVYDVERHQVLIPKGSKVLAHSLLVGNINAPIQSRMGITVERMVLPNGQSIDFSRQAALDREGIAAVEGSTDYHLLEQFLGVAAYALLSAGTSRQGTGISNNSTFAGDVGESAREQFRPLIARYLSLVPTITLSPGTPMRIFLQEEMWITPWKPVGHRFVAGRS